MFNTPQPQVLILLLLMSFCLSNALNVCDILKSPRARTEEEHPPPRPRHRPLHLQNVFHPDIYSTKTYFILRLMLLWKYFKVVEHQEQRISCGSFSRRGGEWKEDKIITNCCSRIRREHLQQRKRFDIQHKGNKEINNAAPWCSSGETDAMDGKKETRRKRRLSIPGMWEMYTKKYIYIYIYK